MKCASKTLRLRLKGWQFDSLRTVTLYALFHIDKIIDFIFTLSVFGLSVWIGNCWEILFIHTLFVVLLFKDSLTAFESWRAILIGKTSHGVGASVTKFVQNHNAYTFPDLVSFFLIPRRLRLFFVGFGDSINCLSVGRGLTYLSGSLWNMALKQDFVVSTSSRCTRYLVCWDGLGSVLVSIPILASTLRCCSCSPCFAASSSIFVDLVRRSIGFVNHLFNDFCLSHAVWLSTMTI